MMRGKLRLRREIRGPVSYMRSGRHVARVMPRSLSFPFFQHSMTSRIGLIGLAVMGQNLALNIAEKGFPISVWNRSTDKTDQTVARAAKENISGLTGAWFRPTILQSHLCTLMFGFFSRLLCARLPLARGVCRIARCAARRHHSRAGRPAGRRGANDAQPSLSPLTLNMFDSLWMLCDARVSLFVHSLFCNPFLSLSLFRSSSR